MWSSSLPPTLNLPARTVPATGQGCVANSKQSLQSPEEIVIESQMQPSAFQAGERVGLFIYVGLQACLGPQGHSACRQSRYTHEITCSKFQWTSKFVETFGVCCDSCCNSICCWGIEPAANVHFLSLSPWTEVYIDDSSNPT